MPYLTFPAQRTGLYVDAIVGLAGAAVQDLMNAGQIVPRPIRARGMIDTGSTVTGVSQRIIQQLGVPILLRTSTQTAAGSVNVQLYEVSLNITDFNNPNAPTMVESTLTVMNLPRQLQDAEVLIGLDMLFECEFLLDGPGRDFTLRF